MKTSGNTPCIRLPDWEELLEFDGVWVKDESRNPTGTFKDRRSEAIIQHAQRAHAQKLVLISMGNAAYSLAKCAEGTGIDVCTVVDRDLTEGIRERLRQICTRVIEVRLQEQLLTSEQLIAMARTSPEEVILDVTNHYQEAYVEIVRELKRDLPLQPDSIYMPFGAGEAMMGVLHGVQEVGWEKGTTVYGIHNSASERLATDFRPCDYLGCFQYGRLPQRLVLGISTRLTQEDMQECVPKSVQAEEAAANVFAYVVAARKKLSALSPHKNIVLLNSGCGKILEETEG